MVEAVAVFVSQGMLVFLKHLNVRLISRHRVLPAVWVTGGIQTAWLISSALGIKGFLSGNIGIVAVYIAAGMIGSFLNFKIKA